MKKEFEFISRINTMTEEFKEIKKVEACYVNNKSIKFVFIMEDIFGEFSFEFSYSLSDILNLREGISSISVIVEMLKIEIVSVIKNRYIDCSRA